MRRLAKYAVAVAIFGTVTAVAAPDSTQPSPGVGSASNPPATTMSLGEMTAAAATLHDRLGAEARHVAELREVAKKQKDVIKLNCVDDHLMQAKAQQNIADATYVQLNAALAQNSPDRVALFQQFSASAESVKKLNEASKGCVGESDLDKQDSGVTVDRPKLTDDPTAKTPSITAIEAPAFASPFD